MLSPAAVLQPLTTLFANILSVAIAGAVRGCPNPQLCVQAALGLRYPSSEPGGRLMLEHRAGRLAVKYWQFALGGRLDESLVPRIPPSI